MKKFENRRAAGLELAQKLIGYLNTPNLMVIALPRGGVPVAAPIAKALHAPLDVLVVRKLGVPGHEELAMGAIAANGAEVLNQNIIQDFGISKQTLEAAKIKALKEVVRRESLFRAQAKPLHCTNKTIILVDDGVATGATVLTAIQLIRAQKPKKLILALPVADSSLETLLSQSVDEYLCLMTPEPLYAVGYWYEDFEQTTDEEVINLLHKS